jgi:hypothetical protein
MLWSKQMTDLHLEEAIRAIEFAKAAETRLTFEGIGTHERPAQPDERWPIVYAGAAFERQRNAFDANEVATAIAFLRRFKPTKTVRSGVRSYALKHSAEIWGRRNGMAGYVSQGELIAAALYLGFKIKAIGRSKETPNGSTTAYVGIAIPELARLDPSTDWSPHWRPKRWLFRADGSRVWA